MDAILLQEVALTLKNLGSCPGALETETGSQPIPANSNPENSLKRM
ncbi:hypothetical protein E2C01_084568 [Portunus trituberculatus]|uniref:Uncharacterized protein n=1 Tax=Portunus trituberculatus TaxID=210409 RepID=A0A5B7JB38_PORTR|nr:hypothetical protein [Portunus trituberculatus]